MKKISKRNKNYLLTATLTAINIYFLPLITYGDTEIKKVNPIVKSDPAAPPITPNSKIVPSARKSVELVFVLDTTGSMSGLIKGAKEKIWSIINTISQARPTPKIKLSIIGFRDRGDSYVTDFNPLTKDTDKLYVHLMQYKAEGGGDLPESVNQALYEAINKIKWTAGTNTYKTIFLVGDSPPHMDYVQDVKYDTSCKVAKEKGIIINTILCGNNHQTLKHWKKIAALTDGEFFQVGQGGDALEVKTPYDKPITIQMIKLEKYIIIYGDKDLQQKSEERKKYKSEIYSKSSSSVNAQRAYNKTVCKESNYVLDIDLVNLLENKKITFDKIESKNLPTKLQSLSSEDLKIYINKLIAKKNECNKLIIELSKKRQDYIKKNTKQIQRDKSFEKQIFDSIKPQIIKNGLKLDDKDIKF